MSTEQHESDSSFDRSLPRVTEETVRGMAGSIIEKRSYFPEAEDQLHDKQPDLYRAIVEWAGMYGPEGLEIAKASAALAYDALSRQVLSNQLRDECPEL